MPTGIVELDARRIGSGGLQYLLVLAAVHPYLRCEGLVPLVGVSELRSRTMRAGSSSPAGWLALREEPERVGLTFARLDVGFRRVPVEDRLGVVDQIRIHLGVHRALPRSEQLG